MKKILALVLVCVMCLSLCACGEAKLYKKYEAVITALENEDYEGAVSEIYNIYLESDQGKADQAAAESEQAEAEAAEAESEAAQKELEANLIAAITGEWIPDDYSVREYEAPPVTVGADNTVEISGESYTFEVNNAYEDNLNLVIKDGDTISYRLSAYKDEAGRYHLSVSEAVDDNNYTSVGEYYLASQYTKVDLTVDNFFDYFEFYEKTAQSKNEFDEVEALRIESCYKLKDEHGKVNTSISKVAIEYSYEYTYKYVDADFDAGTYAIGKAAYGGDPQESDNTTTLSQLYELESYGVSLSSNYISKEAENPTICVYDNYEVTRIAGSLYLYTPAE
ncbi:MAG: hypothetical protein IKZ21_00840 [Clostridia bacterium]|nr:hypothetical protein [Clostridia bacterium]